MALNKKYTTTTRQKFILGVSVMQYFMFNKFNLWTMVEEITTILL